MIGWALLLLAAVIAVPLVIEATRKRMTRDTRRNAPGQFATLSHGVVHYDWLGPTRGPVCVCIHGLTTSSYVWGGLTRGLALMGYSMGGAIAALFAANHPDRVRQLILLAPAGMGLVRSRLNRFITQTPLIGDWLMLAFFPRQLRKGIKSEAAAKTQVENIGDMQQAELNWRGFVPAVLSSLRGVLGRGLKAEHQIIHRAGIPVLAIWGREDTVIPMSSVGVLAEWSRNAHQEVIDGATHALTYTHADQVLQIIRDNPPKL